MIVVASSLRLSPSDLSGFLGCRHRTGLELAAAHGALARPDRDEAALAALRARGEAHERAYVAALRAEGLEIVEVPGDRPTAERVARTREAMRAGAPVIVQAALTDGTWLGYADVLRRVPGGGYEPYDTKLARETRGATILQLAAYVDLLAHIQGARPERFWVVSPGPPDTPFIVTPYRDVDVAAYVRAVRRQLAAALEHEHQAIRDAHYPEPVEDCAVCRWEERCHQRRRADDHLSFIAGIGRLHREELAAHGVPTLAAAAAMPLPLPFVPARGSRDAYARLREQARVQHAQRTARRPVHELLPVVEGQGLSRLPEPSPGDLFLDLEGARFAREGGREYLFGLWGRDAAAPLLSAYTARWAVDDAGERAAFEAVIDQIAAAVRAHPDAHVYHFGHYEPAALKRLMGRHVTRGRELDELLRGGRFVDLHMVVREALRAGVESYSLKHLEPFHGFARTMPLREATAHLQAMELALEAHAAELVPGATRAAIAAYNQDDCRSTDALRDWLEGLRAALVAQGTPVPRPAVQAGEANEKVSELEQRQQAARDRLLDGLPDEAADPAHADHPRWLFAYLLDWHRREDKSAWWEHYRLRDLAEADLFDEPQALAGLELVARISEPGRSVVDRYRYPAQDVELRPKDKLSLPGGASLGTVEAHDRLAQTIDIRKARAKGKADIHPAAVYTSEIISTDVHQDALLRLAADAGADTCGLALLNRRPPRLIHGVFPQRPDEDLVAHAVRLATTLDRTTLAVQGPPGAGKTYVGAQMIRALVHAGKKVGVTAVSHKVIRNLLEAVLEQDRRAPGAAPIVLAHKCDASDEGGAEPPAIRIFDGNDTALGALADGSVQVLGATSWLWARPDAAASVDVLFVDEAGQMSLANALAVSGAARSLVLLGDPQQLEQPQKGTHPDGVGVSALEHVLGGAATMPADRGLFLPTTWRLHPAICAFTSELFYEGKLRPRTGLERQRLDGTGAFDGAGLWWVPVPHDGNQNASLEEVDAVERIVERLLAPGAAWIDDEGTAHPLSAADLRVVAPYNAQVNRLVERLGSRGVPVGTVDKFQGQEAPVVIYSMAASRAEDAPRGMEFLYSLNRLNVASSRARCAAILVASPALLEPACRTPRQMTLANALCRFGELARTVHSAQFSVHSRT